MKANNRDVVGVFQWDEVRHILRKVPKYAGAASQCSARSSRTASDIE